MNRHRSGLAANAALGLGLALLAGCSNLQWQKAGAGPDAASLDESECTRLSRLQSSSMAMTMPPSPPPAVLATPGGTTIVGGGPMPLFAPDPTLSQQYALDCMHQRGYQLVPAAKQARP